jgi:arginine exporter protein ArgO
MDAFVTGIVAGYGIAVPVGAIAILIMDVGIRRGFKPAFAAGAGAATADFIYAGVAFVGGAALAAVIESIEDPLHIVSGVVLLAIAIVGLYRTWRLDNETNTEDFATTDLTRTYARFLGLTFINPTTVIYFAAVVIGLGVAEDMTQGDGALFVLGAFLASLSWQTTLAAVSSLVGHRLSPRARQTLSIVGNLVILAFGIVILSG